MKALYLCTVKQIEEFKKFAAEPDVYKNICSNIAPSIFGHDDAKKAVACLLFGGSRKSLPDGVKLRGDINVLLLGDPSTAKSQFLKFVEKTAPVAVYTSGKGSSAAGLTASVIRDNSSIIASHIIKLHASAGLASSDSKVYKEENWLKRYLQYCRTECHPRLSESASTLLQNNYVKIRQALPYIRCIGESWPMTKERAYFEAVTLREQARLSPEHVSEVYHFDRTMSLIGMRYLEPPHIILRKGLIAGIEYPLLAEHISEFMARTLYFTSLLHRSTAEHKRAGSYLIFKIIVQTYKEWILRTIEETWNLFRKKFIALWDEHKDGSGEAYLHFIYNNPELQQLVQEKFLDDLFHDTLGFGAAKMIRRIVGVAHVEDFESITDASRRADCELRALEVAKLLLKERRKFHAITEVISAIQKFQP
ncbi:hypothetical protein SO802_005860 [Lithocarpus litseifolius]|uniref:DNA helicase n=1 Tax=Lithocarpus litseifolius TaxID=425828 RepID=A0AAW2DJP4_9ROSI